MCHVCSIKFHIHKKKVKGHYRNDWKNVYRLSDVNDAERCQSLGCMYIGVLIPDWLLKNRTLKTLGIQFFICI